MHIFIVCVCMCVCLLLLLFFLVQVWVLVCLCACACACGCVRAHAHAIGMQLNARVCKCVHVCIITANLLPHEQKRVGHDKFPLIPIAYYASYAQMVLPNAEFPVVVKVSHAHRYVRVVCEFVRCVNRSFSLFL